MNKFLQTSFIIFLIIFQSFFVLAQDSRAQYPSFLKNSYFGVNIGYINYAFSQKQLEPGYEAESVNVPHTAVRVILFGYRFNNYLSAQISYMRPVGWVEYKNVNGSHSVHTVGMNVAGMTIRSALPLTKKIAFTSEAGLGVVTRSGFTINNSVAVKDANFASLLLGAGMEYHLNKNWDIMVSTAWTPAHKKAEQPATVFFSAGFNYTMRRLSKETVEKNTNNGYIFPKNLLQLGFTTNALGYGVNNFVSKKVHIFWGGDAEVERGFSIQYQRNVFHSRKVFSLDFGTTFAWWESKNNKDEFFTLSLFPLFRFTAFRSKATDLYFNYSLAGPAFISKTIIDEKKTGKKFTFQDFMGVGIFTGKKRKMNAEIRIAHYSNGNIFPHNDGVKIPLTFNLGYSFE
jgi:hypothetical protein